MFRQDDRRVSRGSIVKISVVTVCLDSALFIGDCLRSVTEQQDADIEHLVIDGGSTDGTLEVLKRHHQPWRRVVSEADGGMYEAMNKGICLASGEVIGFLNSDDFYATPTVLRDVTAVFEDSNVDVCWGDLAYIDRLDKTKQVRLWKSSPFTPGLFAYGWNPPHPTFFVRARVFSCYGGFRTDYRRGNDVELMARLLERHSVAGRYLPQLLVLMRTGGVSNRDFRGVLLQNKELLRAFGQLGIKTSLPRFVLGKCISRALQFIGAK